MNAALRKALAEAQLTETDVAAHLGVDPKTVRRWLSGQRPYPRHRFAISELLQIGESYLWPSQTQQPEARTPNPEEIQWIYAHRWQVSRQVWYDLFSKAEREIGILVYSGLFLADDPGILKLIAGKGQSGVKVRILLGDPESPSIVRRGNEEEITDILSARARNAMLLYRDTMGCDAVEIRTHSATLYNSVYFTEAEVLVNQHIYGLPASQAPVLSLIRSRHLSMSGAYVRSFNAIWNESKPAP